MEKTEKTAFNPANGIRQRFLRRGDRTIDQMVQAARTGKQNIIEGCQAWGMSDGCGREMKTLAMLGTGENHAEKPYMSWFQPNLQSCISLVLNVVLVSFLMIGSSSAEVLWGPKTYSLDQREIIDTIKLEKAEQCSLYLVKESGRTTILWSASSITVNDVTVKFQPLSGYSRSIYWERCLDTLFCVLPADTHFVIHAVFDLLPSEKLGNPMHISTASEVIFYLTNEHRQVGFYTVLSRHYLELFPTDTHSNQCVELVALDTSDGVPLLFLKSPTALYSLNDKGNLKFVADLDPSIHYYTPDGGRTFIGRNDYNRKRQIIVRDGSNITIKSIPDDEEGYCVDSKNKKISLCSGKQASGTAKQSILTVRDNLTGQITELAGVPEDLNSYHGKDYYNVNFLQDGIQDFYKVIIRFVRQNHGWEEWMGSYSSDFHGYWIQLPDSLARRSIGNPCVLIGPQGVFYALSFYKLHADSLDYLLSTDYAEKCNYLVLYKIDTKSVWTRIADLYPIERKAPFIGHDNSTVRIDDSLLYIYNWRYNCMTQQLSRSADIELQTRSLSGRPLSCINAVSLDNSHYFSFVYQRLGECQDVPVICPTIFFPDGRIESTEKSMYSYWELMSPDKKYIAWGNCRELRMAKIVKIEE